MHMAKHFDNFMKTLSLSMAQMGVSGERIENRNYSSSLVNETRELADAFDTKVITSRAYQLEMLEESIRGNTIVVMDTGSGKTQVAVLRIKHELEKAITPKLVWFLAPTVILACQQFDVIKSQISSVQIKCLTSADNVDRWTEKKEWDIVLAGIRIVVSTHAVLHEALCHAFVNMESLALIVFDEVHGCVGKSAGSKIMRDFYWHRKEAQQCVPHILGLTASPVIGSKLSAFEPLEKLFDSICRTPRLHREELLHHVHRPSLTQIHFEAINVSANASNRTNAMVSLLCVYRALDILKDPEILDLKTINTEESEEQIKRAILGHKTFVQDQMKSFSATTIKLHGELGAWAADFFIAQGVSTCKKSADTTGFASGQWKDTERRYLAKVLQNVDISPIKLSSLSEVTISEKVRVLIDFLRSCDGSTTGIIFVKDRATAYVLRYLLSRHAESSRKLRFETVIGVSQNSQKNRGIFEIPNPTDALARFRSGEINILIATSVLEEGIDVPKCQLVICFDGPTSVKSYIQCRGRARLPGSKWVVLLERSAQDLTKRWEDLEREMKKIYDDEERNLRRIEAIEEAAEKDLWHSRQFREPSTGALLDLENAKSHLQCFCSRLSSHLSVDMKPKYIMEDTEDNNGASKAKQLMVRARVILPATLESNLRVFYSRYSWPSEKSATKDAAFEAYVSLYKAGLINEHLLPLNTVKPSRYMEKGDAIVDCRELFKPWCKIARAWKAQENLQRRILTLHDQNNSVICKIDMSIPGGIFDMEPISMYWDAFTVWKLDIGPPRYVRHSELTVDHTTTLLSLAFGHRWNIENLKSVVHFEATSMDISDDRNLFGSEEAIDVSLVHLKKRTRRLDFLHQLVAPELQPTGGEYVSVLPLSVLTAKVVPTVYSEFGMLIPSILHKFEIQLIMKELCATLLMGVEISDTTLIRTALSAPVAREEDNYQKLEFLGDSVLKFLVSVFLTSKHASWPEGYLSFEKAKIISNSRLSAAAIERRLDKFILLKPFTGRKWRPLYVDRFLEDGEEGSRKVSSKTIADVVESLIGAGWKMGSCQTSLLIAKIFLPELDLPSLEVGRARLFDLAPAGVPLPLDFNNLETLIGYCFQRKSLAIQAMSHRSYQTAVISYERLEFLGDSILEHIIVTELTKYADQISCSLMHLFKTVLVNGDYLGFIALEWNITQTRIDLKENERTRVDEKLESTFSLPLWRFMRHHSPEIGTIQCEVERRYRSLRLEILNAIDSGPDYPWTLLASLKPNKFYSDIIESLLAAVWIDSGSLDVCKQLLKRMGVLRYLERLVHGQVHALHPREELGILANGKEVKYDVHTQKLDDGTDGWSCKIHVGESFAFEETWGMSNDEVRTKGAEHAVGLLRFAEGRSGEPVSYGERITRIRS